MEHSKQKLFLNSNIEIHKLAKEKYSCSFDNDFKF